MQALIVPKLVKALLICYGSQMLISAFYKNPTLHPILIRLNPVQNLICNNRLILFTHYFPDLQSRFFFSGITANFLNTLLLYCSRYVLRPSYLPWLHHPINIWWILQTPHSPTTSTSMQTFDSHIIVAIRNPFCPAMWYYFFSNGSTAPWGPRPPHFSRLHNHTLFKTHHTL